MGSENKLPYMQFYVNDWLSDTAMLSPATKGIWIDILAIMHIRRTGTITANIDKLSRACRCRISEMESALNEINAEKIADIDGCYENVTDVFSITCRRLQRIENERNRAKEAMKKKRTKTQCYGDVTEMLRECDGDVTPYNTESESEYNIYSHFARTRENEQTTDLYPKTIQDILAIASSVHCAKKCTEAQADEYLTHRIAGDWFDSARRKILPSNVAFDLKKWLMREEQKNNPPKNTKFNSNKGHINYASGKNLASDPADYGQSDPV